MEEKRHQKQWPHRADWRDTFNSTDQEPGNSTTTSHWLHYDKSQVFYDKSQVYTNINSIDKVRRTLKYVYTVQTR